MLNFTVGPVMSSDLVCAIGQEQVPYFRTSEFSELMLESERLLKNFAGAQQNARSLFITGSGTASMEAVVMNVFNSQDKVLVVNGGSFGSRFVELCRIHDVPCTSIDLQYGEPLTANHLISYENQGYTGFLVNKHETSTGVHYDMQVISDFCKRNDLFLVVDAISSFLADPFNMEELDVQVMITGSQKALACPPGISIIVLSPKAVMRINHNKVRSMYFDLSDALRNGERGQTPFTPAVGIIRQIHARLKEIDSNGGVNAEVSRTAALAQDFRNKIVGLPFIFFTNCMSNAVTPLHPLNASAHQIFLTLKDEYGIWICPNGGELKDRVFRVGHIGNLNAEDNSTLVNAMIDMQKRGLI